MPSGMHPPRGASILVAMSGGVDSAVTAALLVEAGYDCLGVTMRLAPEPAAKPIFEPCCGLEAARDAQRVCEKLGIPHQSMHAVDRFERDVIADFLSEYQAGRTPNPCVRCNQLMKFGALYEEAARLDAQWIAMGHYARLESRGDRLALRRGAHRPKDQSYVLAPLSQAQLRRALFPLGGMTKAQVREKAKTIDLGAASKAESQEICFVPDRDYAAFIETRTAPSPPGPMLSVSGKALGRHRGLIHYTVGQRKGLGIGGAGEPYYVVRLDVPRNTLIVGHAHEAVRQAFTTHEIHWGGHEAETAPIHCHVQLHSRHEPTPATLTLRPDGGHVALEVPQRFVTPGQWAVFYDGEYVIASAIVSSG